MSCKENNSTPKDLSEMDRAEQEDKIQESCDLEENQTERSAGLDALEALLEALERENMVLKEQLHQDKIQEPDSLKHENDVCAQEELKTSEGDNVPQQETPEEKLQAEGSDGLDTLGPKLEALESQNKVLTSEVEQLKIHYECMAEKYTAEKTEKETLQNIIQELNIKLQNQMDLCTQQQLKASEKGDVLCREIEDLREALQKEHDEDSNLQAWEQEKKVLLREIEDLKLCYEGKTLRFHDMFEKLRAEKARKEAIKEEQFKKIQALNIKVRQQQETLIQQKVKASEREKKLSQELEELEEKISCYEKGARPKLRTNAEDESLADQGPKKKRKGWKKVIYNMKPWHWGK